MSGTWQQPPIDTDSGMNLGAAYPRDRSSAARTVCIHACDETSDDYAPSNLTQRARGPHPRRRRDHRKP